MKNLTVYQQYFYEFYEKRFNLGKYHAGMGSVKVKLRFSILYLITVIVLIMFANLKCT